MNLQTTHPCLHFHVLALQTECSRCFSEPVSWNYTGFKRVALRTVWRKIQGDYWEPVLQSMWFAFWFCQCGVSLGCEDNSIEGRLCLSQTTVFQIIQLNLWWVQLLQNFLLAMWVGLLTGKLIAYLRWRRTKTGRLGNTLYKKMPWPTLTSFFYVECWSSLSLHHLLPF